MAKKAETCVKASSESEEVVTSISSGGRVGPQWGLNFNIGIYRKKSLKSFSETHWPEKLNLRKSYKLFTYSVSFTDNLVTLQFCGVQTIFIYFIVEMLNTTF